MQTIILKLLASLFMATVAFAETRGIVIAPTDQTTKAQAEAILSYVPKEDEVDPYSLVWYFSRKYNADLSLAIKIADCESNWDVDAKNSKSTAYGVFQMLNGTFEHVKKLSGLPLKRGVLKDEVEAAIWLLKNEGVKHWNASAKCWND